MTLIKCTIGIVMREECASGHKHKMETFKKQHIASQQKANFPLHFLFIKTMNHSYICMYIQTRNYLLT